MREKSVGFVGLGRMGRGMAANLVSAGVLLTVFDTRLQAVQGLADKGADVAASSADAASRVDILFLCLPADPEVEDVLFGEQGALSGARPGLCVIDMTTMNHRAALGIAERVARAGCGYSDCPISGMPFRAADGSLTIMFGGSHETFLAVKPLLDIMGAFVVHCGPVGAGQLMKALNNIIYDVNIAAICEVLPLAVKAGLDPDTVAEVVTSGSSRSFASEYFVPRILERRFDTDFAMAAAYKDIVNVQELATRLGASTPVVNAMIATYQHAIALGFGVEPKSAMVKVYERVLGQEVRSSTEREE